jgi:hypothetical protein
MLLLVLLMRALPDVDTRQPHKASQSANFGVPPPRLIYRAADEASEFRCRDKANAAAFAVVTMHRHDTLPKVEDRGGRRVAAGD